ncbi:MAG: hypothetical protein ABI183_18140 [Polyangiaceae bacterium]
MKSIASRIVPFAAVAVTLFSLSGTARADALPPSACEDVSLAGQACSVAGPNEDQAGTCVATTCPHSAHYEDGGFGPVTNDPCAICEAPDGGSTSGDGGAVTTRPDAGASSTPSSSSGCSATPDTRDSATGFGMLVLGMIGLGLSRRKNKKSA